MTKKTPNEIRALLNSVQLDFEKVVNTALNDYLPNYFIAAHLLRKMHNKAMPRISVLKNGSEKNSI